MGYKFPDEVQDDDDKKLVAQDGGLDITIIDDTPASDKGRKPLNKEVNDPTDEEIENYSEGVKKRIADLTHARHDERRAKEAIAREREELERMAKVLLQENNQLKQFVNNGSKEYGDTIKQSAEQALEMARRNYKIAQDAFDTDGIIAAQEALTEAKLKVEAAKNFRPSTLQQSEFPVQQQQVQQQVVGPDEKTLRWQAKNQWFGQQGFEDITSYALGLHQKLVNSGVDPQSDEYFNKVDSQIKKTFPDLFEEAQSNKEPAGRKTPNVVAPAARSTGTKKIQLTQTQVALAKKFGLTNEQYAREVLKMER